MSIAGFRKQLNKANQFVSEKIGGAKGTELDNDFIEMERKIDVCSKLIDDVISRTQEYLQPNPASRAKMTTLNTINKLQGKARSSATYPQPEGTLGETMVKHGTDLGNESVYGQALIEAGEAFKQMAENKYGLEDQVKQNFLEPMHGLQTRELKEIFHHRKKLQSRRLDFDCKKRKESKGVPGGSKISEEEIHLAEEKFEESKSLAENAMLNFLNSDVEHIQALHEFVMSELEYHRLCADILDSLQRTLADKKSEAAARPRKEQQVVARKSTPHHNSSSSESATTAQNNSTSGNNGGWGFDAAKNALSSRNSDKDEFGAAPNFSMKSKYETNSQTATARALYDFEPENPTELAFSEGDMIKLVSRVDDNWFEGEVKGKKGYFPVNYVEVVVPLHN